VLTNTDFDLGLRIRFVICYVWTVLLYGMEGWTLKMSTMNKLEAFEMWIYRRVLKIPWTNDEVLRIINKDRELLDTIKRGKTAYLGHVICNERYQFVQLLIEGKRGIGRKKMSWLRNVRQWIGEEGRVDKCNRKHPLMDTQQKKKKSLCNVVVGKPIFLLNVVHKHN